MRLTTRQQEGLFIGSHAVAAGSATRAQLQSGLYRRLLHNVYADPGLEADHRLYARAASLIMPSDGVLGGHSAAAWYDATLASPRDPVLVIVPAVSSWRGPRGVRVHRRDLRPHEIVSIENGHEAVRLTTPIRTAWEIAALETLPNAVALLDAMVHAGHVDEQALLGLVEAVRGQWGSRRVATVMPMVDGRSQSPAESWVRVACVRAGLPVPTPQFVVIEAGQFLGKVDLAWPEYRLIVEYEGPHHFDPDKKREDDLRYELLVRAGWRVIRLANAELRDMSGVVARIAAALGMGAAIS